MKLRRKKYYLSWDIKCMQSMFKIGMLRYEMKFFAFTVRKHMHTQSCMVAAAQHSTANTSHTFAHTNSLGQKIQEGSAKHFVICIHLAVVHTESDRVSYGFCQCMRSNGSASYAVNWYGTLKYRVAVAIFFSARCNKPLIGKTWLMIIMSHDICNASTMRFSYFCVSSCVCKKK